MNKQSRLIPFIIGLVIGVIGAIYVPGYVRPYIPEWAMGKAIVVKGTVAAKQKKESSVLLTVNTAEGALLATFTRKVDEINLLVNEKDVIEFTLQKYSPLVDDPRITRVLREHEAAPARLPVDAPAPAAPAVKKQAGSK